MSRAGEMKARDDRMFNGELIRDRVYRGEDMSLTNKGDVAIVVPKDHGVRPLLGKFSSFNLSFLTPEQRQIFLEQMKYELSLSGAALNQYLTDRYSAEDMYQIWLLQQKASKRRAPKVATKVKNKGLKQRVSRKQKRIKMTPEQLAARTAKARATRERNKLDPNYVSYDTMKREFMRLQKLLATRNEIRMKQTAEVFSQEIIKRKVRQKTLRYERENQQLKEYLKQNNLPLPGTAKDKMRREQLRRQSD